VTNGPEALKKYSGDKAIVEAWVEAAQIIEQQQAAEGAIDGAAADAAADAAGAPPAGGGCGGGGGALGAPPGGLDAAGLARAQAALGVSPAELMAKVAARPELVARVRDPAVAAALAEVAAAPWKVVKYLLNREVMATLRVRRGVDRMKGCRLHWGGAGFGAGAG
jgi:hypothetical protein